MRKTAVLLILMAGAGAAGALGYFGLYSYSAAAAGCSLAGAGAFIAFSRWVSAAADHSTRSDAGLEERREALLVQADKVRHRLMDTWRKAAPGGRAWWTPSDLEAPTHHIAHAAEDPEAYGLEDDEADLLQAYLEHREGVLQKSSPEHMSKALAALREFLEPS